MSINAFSCWSVCAEALPLLRQASLVLCDQTIAERNWEMDDVFVKSLCVSVTHGLLCFRRLSQQTNDDSTICCQKSERPTKTLRLLPSNYLFWIIKIKSRSILNVAMLLTKQGTSVLLNSVYVFYRITESDSQTTQNQTGLKKKIRGSSLYF